MYDIVDIEAGDYDGIADPTGFDPRQLDLQGTDKHFAVLDRRQRIRARCSIWWRDTAIVSGRRIGAIGHYAADGAGSARVLLRHACREIKARGCRLAIGPLDGSTWRRYRFVTDRGEARPFYLEPDNPDAWPRQFADNGFGCYADYVSELNTNILERQPELGDLRARFARAGVSVETLDIDGLAEDLQGIHRVVCRAFAGSILFTPLDFDEFMRLYAPVITTVDPRLMLVARDAGRIVGFVFAPPDFLQDRDPAAVDTIVIKTIAVLPQQRYRGLGRVLIVDMLENAIAAGYRQAISALMYTANRSQEISRACARPMRGYRLFARPLG